MAQGDVFPLTSTVSNAGYFSMQPSAGVEVVISNIFFNGNAELYFYDGSNRIGPIDSFNGPSGVFNLRLHCTNTYYYQLKNVSGSDALMGCEGVVLK